MVSWETAFKAALKIVVLEVLVFLAFSIVNAGYILNLSNSIMRSLTSGSSLSLNGTTTLILLVIDFLLGILAIAIPIKILTDLVSNETFNLVAQGRKDVYSWLCPKCGQMNPTIALYCSHCGSKFGENNETTKKSDESGTYIPPPKFDPQPVTPKKQEFNDENKLIQSTEHKPEKYEVEKPIDRVEKNPMINNEIKPDQKKSFHMIGDSLFSIIGGGGVILLGYFVNVYLHLETFTILFNGIIIVGIAILGYGVYLLNKNYY